MPTKAPGPARRGAEVTKTKFLKATEQLFRRRGYEGTTIRDIARRAGVNLGTLQHYWGSKPAVFRDLFEQRFRSMRDAFLDRLQQIQRQAVEGTVLDATSVLAALVDASFRPGVAGTPTARTSQRELFGRALTDPSPVVIREMNRLYEEPMLLFIDLLRRACPRLPEAELDWRINCVIGVNLFSLVQGPRMRRYFGTGAQVPDAQVADWILAFLVRGFEPTATAPAMPATPVTRRAAPRSRPRRA